MKPFDLRLLQTRSKFGWVYLSVAGITHLNQAVEMLNSIRNNQDHRAPRHDHNHSRQILARLKEDTSSKHFYTDAKTLCRQSRSLLTSNRLRSWETQQISWLNESENWLKLIDLQPEAKGSLIKLKQFWDTQKAFSLCSNDFLLQSMESVLLIESELALAEVEFIKKQRKLSDDIKKSYGDFLFDLRQEVNKTKSGIVNTMLARLFVAGKLSEYVNHLHSDDVLVYTIHSLQQIGVLKRTMELTGSWQTLDSKHFNAFHDFIFREGNLSQQKALCQMPWFSESAGQIKTKNIMVNHRLCVVPIGLDHSIPQSAHKRKPEWFYQNQNRSLDFISEQQATIARMKLGLPKIRSLEVNDRFKKLDRYERILKNAKRFVAKQQPVWWQFWSYFKFKKQLDSYQTLLIQQSKRCHEERIKLLEEIAHQELPPNDRNARYQLWLLLRNQLSLLNKNPALPSTLKTRVNTVERALTASLQQEPTTYANCLLQAISDKEVLDQYEINYLKAFIEINSLSPDKHLWLDSLSQNQRELVERLTPQAIINHPIQQQTKKRASVTISNTNQIHLFRKNKPVKRLEAIPIPQTTKTAQLSFSLSH